MPTNKTITPPKETNVTLRIKFMKVRPDATAPTKEDGDAGWDFTVPQNMVIPSLSYGNKIPLGIAMEIPQGYYMQLVPRSSTGAKTPLRISNAPGTIDSSYRGEIMALVDNLSEMPFDIKKGRRLFQGILHREVNAVMVESTSLSKTKRGDGGIGSTGD